MNGLLISDFNIENLAAYLKRDDRQLPVSAVKVSYGQVTRVLMDHRAEEWSPRPEFTVVWTRPEAALSVFSRLLDGNPDVSESALLDEVDGYAAALAAAADLTGALFVPLWTLPPNHAGRGLLDLAPTKGPARALLQANQRLLARLDGKPGVFPLLASRWLELCGPGAYSARLWYLGKIPFVNEVFRAAACDIAAGLSGLHGRARKVIICDLDDTLWGGIVGDDGWQQLVLGGHDPMGEALVDFQKTLKALTRRGVVLALVSKNDEDVALEALRKHPEMVLRPEDFAAWRINWDDKAKNIIDLMAELNLGLESAVFLDDNAVERQRVRDALPEVLVPEWPADKRLYPQALLALDCFDRPRATDEDRTRTAMYATERLRSQVMRSTESLDDWLGKLGVTIRVEALSADALVRATQLLNKTNQMNVSTRRLSESEFMEWSRRSGHEVFTLRVGDKFGDSGLTGLLALSADSGKARVVDFVLSCRVFGRKVEEAMLHVAVEWARLHQLDTVEAVFLPTPKNKPCLDFFRRSGFQEHELHRFSWPTAQPYQAPLSINLELAAISHTAGPTDATRS
ncbi:FkbH domain protein [Luteitalea pratensis]|uniref:FkbH domain protein n=1 Tax=Luteitalea pratensis TaxID=1855912 RepID=A0A143PXJ8_LUTPR|nr:HAD-IIIC family phosphatase [Luteitalea pratensis]AMY12966.1 FkbH domain protein [Luteitalea pratensis]